MSLTYDGQTAYGYFDSPDRVLTLRPGTYWLTVNNTSNFHNFTLRGPNGLDQDITPEGGAPDGAPGLVTVKILLKHGSYTLLCYEDAHAARGMYVNIEVGGVGQVG